MTRTKREDTLQSLSERLAGLTQEIDKQELDKKSMDASYNAAIRQLKNTQRKVAALITNGQWSEEDLVNVGVRAAPLDRMMIAAGEGSQ